MIDELCQACVLPANFPGVHLDENRICNFCSSSSAAMLPSARKDLLKRELLLVLQERKGADEYDCVVAFSGGKDSSYALMLLVREFGLRCLAVTVNNGFISPQAVENCATITSALEVDLLTYTPSFSFMKGMYVESSRNQDVHVKSAIKRSSAICGSCINLINNYMIKTALAHNVPVIAGGYIGGQVPADTAILRFNVTQLAAQKALTLKKNIQHFGPLAERYFGVKRVNGFSHEEITIINPLLTVDMSEESIISEIEAIGWKRTTDTGLNSSNCQLNDLGIFVHHQKHRFHPYVFEVSEQIRAGLMSREEGLRKIGHIPSAPEISSQLQRLGLRAEQFG